jgi:nitroimidazol reductase NimA-like FMN-containing flavoprotein (pyridoxamine 5'-phosphate oxidase superfamily)
MRRSDKEISDPKAIDDIISSSIVCKLAMSHENRPYLVPLCFGYRDGALYFHSAPEGKKIEILKANPDVCFLFEIYTQVIKSAEACKWGMKYRSVMGFGKASFITDSESKKRAFDIIMKQYDDGSFSYNDALLDASVIIKVEIDHMTGKGSEI